MTEEDFVSLLDTISKQLTEESRKECFTSARDFEQRVRELTISLVQKIDRTLIIELTPPAQSFPDIAVGAFGIEVKFTSNDTWLSIANSILESNRVASIERIFIVFGKMGGIPEVRWSSYEDCVVHVRTSHVPRFEVEIPPTGGTQSLFKQIGIPYEQFRRLPMEQKMRFIREYARGRLKKGERLWWLDDKEDPEHVLPIQARLYTKLSQDEKKQLRAEAILLCPRIVEHSRSRDKYDDAVLYLLTYRGVLCHQARDLFSAGSVANPNNDDSGGIYIERALKLIEPEILDAATRLEDALFVEYWGRSVPIDKRIEEWLRQADALARDWTPSQSLFLEYQSKHTKTIPDN